MKKKRTILVTTLCFVVTLGLLTALLPKISAQETKWDISFDKVSGNSALGQTGYRAMQGIGFDTYTGKDGYVFMQSDDKKTFMLSHFTMESSGFCTKVKAVKYQTANVGHANDATVYKDDNGQKWLIFAPCGTYDEDNTAKATDGTKLSLGAIKLDASGNPGTTVYSCNVSSLQSSFLGDGTNKGNITGITYKGKDFDANGSLKPVFIVMNAKALYEAYLSVSGNKLTFTPTGVFGKVDKPKLPSGTEADTQGIVYHNNYIYLTGEGKDDDKKGSNAAEMAVARISLPDLYGGDPGKYKPMEVYKANKKTSAVTKHGPEAAFFTSLNEKSHLYIGVNRQVSGKDDDEIERTPMRF